MQDEAPLIIVSDPSRLQAVDIAISGADRPPFRVSDHPRWAALLLALVVLGTALLTTRASQRRDVAEERASALDFRTENRGYNSEGVAGRPKEDIYTIKFDLHDIENRDFQLVAVSFQGLPVPLNDLLPGATTRQLIKLHLPRGCAAVGQLPGQLILKVTAQRPGHRQIAMQVPVDAAEVHRSAQMDCELANG